MQGRQGGAAEGRGQLVEVVADFVDGAVFGLGEVSGRGGEGVLFEEEAHFVAAGEEVVVAYVGGLFAGGEFGHGVVG